MARKKHKKSKKSRFLNLLFLISLLIIAIFVAVAYQNYQKSENLSPQKKDERSTKELMNKMRAMLNKEKERLKEESLKIDKKSSTSKVKSNILDKKIEKKIVKKVEKKEENSTKKESKKSAEYLSEINDYKKSLKHSEKTLPKRVVKKESKYSGKPKLAIIIDDVSFLYQVKLIKKIPYKVNPSFFPLTPRHPQTKELSKKFSFAMVHLPMEALHYARAERDTLLVSDSKNVLKNKIDNIKRDFPGIRYYNNHTGSKFTSNKKAMERFVDLMQKEGLVFVDSRTTASTKAPEIYKRRGIKLLSRDVFLDNSTKPSDIITQLKKAVKIAKKHGYAIAICHPHTNTLKTLIKAKPYLKGVETVYINEL